jgi:hypothetical protein
MLCLTVYGKLKYILCVMLQMMDDDDDECGAAGGISGRGYQSTI